MLWSKSFKLGFSSMWIENFQMYKLGFRKGRGTRGQIAHIHWILEKERELQKNIFCFIDYTQPLSVWVTTNCGKFLKRWDYQSILPVSWETCMQVKKHQLEPNMEQWTGFKIGKGVWQGCILSPCLFNIYAEYIMRNGLGESQAVIKIVGRNINNLRYEDDIPL